MSTTTEEKIQVPDHVRAANGRYFSDCDAVFRLSQNWKSWNDTNTRRCKTCRRSGAEEVTGPKPRVQTPRRDAQVMRRPTPKELEEAALEPETARVA